MEQHEAASGRGAGGAVVYAPLEARIAVEQLLLPYSVNAVYVYRAWLGAGGYTVCFHGVSGVNTTLIWAGGPQAITNTSVNMLSGLGCVTSVYSPSPMIIVVRVHDPPYTAHVSEFIVLRVVAWPASRLSSENIAKRGVSHSASTG